MIDRVPFPVSVAIAAVLYTTNRAASVETAAE
jgi:hypothetical protein